MAVQEVEHLSYQVGWTTHPEEEAHLRPLQEVTGTVRMVMSGNRLKTHPC